MPKNIDTYESEVQEIREEITRFKNAAMQTMSDLQDLLNGEDKKNSEEKEATMRDSVA